MINKKTRKQLITDPPANACYGYLTKLPKLNSYYQFYLNCHDRHMAGR